jgi:hypothetical protein
VDRENPRACFLRSICSAAGTVTFNAEASDVTSALLDDVTGERIQPGFSRFFFSGDVRDAAFRIPSLN